METSVIKSPTLPFPLNYESNSHSPTFLFHQGFNSPEFHFSDIEMITFQSVTYTSLRDLISSPSPATVSSLSTHNSIPIKNPLVQKAALSYLLPMATPPEIGDRGFLAKLRENGFGCLGWFSDVVLKTAKEVFAGISDERRAQIKMGEEDEEEEGEDEVEEEEKV